MTYHGRKRQGFTLVEMLVAVGIVLLMMTMFAQIFTMATGAISTQRGMANNDQKTRSIFTVIQADLDKRTFRVMVPHHPEEDATTSPNPFTARRGYFYISANNLDDGADNVLQFTVSSRNIQENSDESPYVGRAVQLFGPGGFAVDTNGSGSFLDEAATDLVANPNQPEADDARVEPNATAESSAVEVSYFVRGGNLYRRELLLREPLELAGEETKVQPELADGTDMFDLDGNPLTTDYVFQPEFGTGNYHADFDIAAIKQFGLTSATATTTSAAILLGIESLNNEAVGTSLYSVGKPQYRWGHNTYIGNNLFGQPREFTVPPGAGGTEFIGRFLHEETSSPLFGYPQGSMQDLGGNVYGTVGHPMDTVDTPLAGDFALGGSRRVSVALANGPRRAEEMLLAGVHEFRVEIWDNRLNRFVSPAHNETDFASGIRGDYHVSRRWNPAYGPFAFAGTGSGTIANRVFDTWHPRAIPTGDSSRDPNYRIGLPTDLGSDIENQVFAPPFRAMTYYPPRISDNPAGPAPDSWPASDTPIPFVSHNSSTRPPSHPYWQPNTEYGVGSVVFPLTRDPNQNGIEDDGDETLPANASSLGDLNEPSRPFGFSYYYLCIQPGLSGAEAPNWQARDGARISEESSAAGDQIPGVASDNEPIWIAVPNLRPVRAIRITVQFLDQGTEEMRQVSIVHSLID